MKTNPLLLFALFFLLAVITCSQVPPAVGDVSRGHVLEITYNKGSRLAYQRIGERVWYGYFGHVPDWKDRAGALPIAAVRISPREDAGSVKVRVEVLRGQNLEAEDLVTEVVVTESKTAVQDLTRFGIVPFELRLVRAPSSAAELPTITNETKSLLASVEPVASTLPSFRARFLNNSSKPVIGFSWRTSINDETKRIAIPQNRNGEVLIEPGGNYELVLAYPLQATVESIGEVPKSQTGLQLNVLSVIFADGTYEGDRIQAARFLGYKIGETIQLTRVTMLLRDAGATEPIVLAEQVDRLSYRISAADVTPLVAQFPNLPPSVAEDVRSAAEFSASGIQKDIQKTFGRSGSAIGHPQYNDLIKEALSRSERWIKFLPKPADGQHSYER